MPQSSVRTPTLSISPVWCTNFRRQNCQCFEELDGEHVNEGAEEAWVLLLQVAGMMQARCIERGKHETEFI